MGCCERVEISLGDGPRAMGCQKVDGILLDKKKYSPPHGNLRASRSNASSDSQEYKHQEPLRMLKVMFLV